MHIYVDVPQLNMAPRLSSSFQSRLSSLSGFNMRIYVDVPQLNMAPRQHGECLIDLHSHPSLHAILHSFFLRQFFFSSATCASS
jgi:hypothetical protein